MAEFKLTFEDGSNGYLAHHGIKGMHWGVHNAETQRRYNSKKYGYDSKTKQHVKKSIRTRSFERLADSGEKHEKIQRDLYNKTKNPYNKSSADKWKQESAENRKNAEKSFQNDIAKKTLSKKDYYVKKEADKLKDSADQNKQLGKQYEKRIAETRKNKSSMIKTAKKQGFSQKQSEALHKYAVDRDTRYLEFIKDGTKAQKISEQKIRNIDTNSQSYRKVKKQVNNILKEHDQYISTRYRNYLNEERVNYPKSI